MPSNYMKLSPKRAYLEAIGEAKRKGRNRDDQLSIFLTLIEPYNKEWERRQQKQASLFSSQSEK